MVIQVVASISDDFGYYWNLSFLKRALQDDEVAFDGVVNNYAPGAIVFDDKTCVYNFTRSAKKKIREDMTTHLIQPNVLPGLTGADQQTIQEQFDCLFNHLGYKTRLEEG